jgi:hypothetical protein
MASPRESKEKDSGIANGTARSESAVTLGSQSPTHEEIAIAAYQIYVNRAGGEGSEIEDWLQAERELSEQLEIRPKTKSTTA